MPVNQRTTMLVAAVMLSTAIAVTAHPHAGHGSGHARKPTTEELAAFAQAKPAFERHCFRCHTTAGKKSKHKALDHMSMDSYPFGGHHADEAGRAIRKVLGAAHDGKATMPSDDPGAVKGDDLKRILSWADAFDRAHPAEHAQAEQSTPAHVH
jgi:hypothetical protein